MESWLETVGPISSIYYWIQCGFSREVRSRLLSIAGPASLSNWTEGGGLRGKINAHRRCPCRFIGLRILDIRHRLYVWISFFLMVWAIMTQFHTRCTVITLDQTLCLLMMGVVVKIIALKKRLTSLNINDGLRAVVGLCIIWDSIQEYRIVN